MSCYSPALEVEKICMLDLTGGISARTCPTIDRSSIFVGILYGRIFPIKTDIPRVGNNRECVLAIIMKDWKNR